LGVRSRTATEYDEIARLHLIFKSQNNAVDNFYLVNHTDFSFGRT
jgi:hypothetical protein